MAINLQQICLAAPMTDIIASEADPTTDIIAIMVPLMTNIIVSAVDPMIDIIASKADPMTDIIVIIAAQTIVKLYNYLREHKMRALIHRKHK
jgi:hypothetical protein